MRQSLGPSAIRLLLIPSIILIVSPGLSIGLTYAPCFASLCNEEFYPFETRLHLAIYYAILGSTACGLGAYTYFEQIRRIFSLHLTRRTIPLLGFRVTVGGILLTVWIGGLILACIAIWLPAAEAFYGPRAEAVGWLEIEPYLAVTNLIGHHCDILAGLLLFPITRNSLMGRVFKLHTPSLLFAHKFIAYWLLISIVAHAVPYFAALPQMATQHDLTRRNAFDQDNPNISVDEADARSSWDLGVLGEGVLALLVMLTMVVSSLPYCRRIAYNTFYYIHIIGAVLFMALISFHASSSFYCLIPGLLLWGFDIAVRIRSLSRPRVKATLQGSSNGWYRILLPSEKGYATKLEDMAVNPLQTYYVNVPIVSKLQVHAFTAKSIGSSAKGAELLLRRSGGKAQKGFLKEWTWKLADLLVESEDSALIDIRMEGPYVQQVPGMLEATHILCVVGGTGITGAYSLANDWLEHRSRETESHFTLVWTIRDDEIAELDEIRRLRQDIHLASNMTLDIHVSGRSGRIDPASYVQRIFNPKDGVFKNKNMAENACPTESCEEKGGAQGSLRGFVYCSGPDGLLEATESACIAHRSDLRKVAPRKSINWYVASWQV